VVETVVSDVVKEAVEVGIVSGGLYMLLPVQTARKPPIPSVHRRKWEKRRPDL
jgi:hypothetical protein